jgi:hypothetical protein
MPPGSLKKPTMYDPIGRRGLMLNCGIPGPEGPLSEFTPRSAWNTKKPVAPGSSTCVLGRKAPIGLEGEALIPRYASRNPEVHAVGLNRVAIAGEVAPPVIEKLPALARLFGTSTSILKSPELAGELVNANGFAVPVGVFVPLSRHVDVAPDPHHPWSVADAGTASIARDRTLANTPRSADLTLRFRLITIPSPLFTGTPRFTVFI